MQLTADFNMIYVTSLICIFYSSICISLRSLRLATFLLVGFPPEHECEACRDYTSQHTHPQGKMHSVNNNLPTLKETQQVQKRDNNKKDRGDCCERFHG